MTFLLYGLGGAAVLFVAGSALYFLVVLPFKGLMAYTEWAERRRKKEAEREYYRLPKILGGDGN